MDLIQRCRAGDEDALAALFHRYKDLIYKTAYLFLGNAQDAEDALQDVFVKVYRSLGTFNPRKGAFTTWLRRITVNHCLNMRRCRRLEFFPLENSAIDLSPSARTPHRSSPEEVVMNRQRAKTVWREIQRLSPPLRATVILRYCQELSYREVAEVLEIPLGTVKWRLHEALKTLRKALAGPTGARVAGQLKREERRLSHEMQKG